MSCRHDPGDPACSSHPDTAARLQAENIASASKRRMKEVEAKVAEILARTPNPEVFEVIETEQIGTFLVMMLQYSSCKKCSFDSKKVLVFENTNLKAAIKWKVIDPHFAEESSKDPKHAPSPIARFPACPTGWSDAIMFANLIKDQTR